MALSPFNPNEALPGDTDVAAGFPAVERTFRDIIESWIITEHGRSGHHTIPIKTTVQRDAITDWEAGSLVYNSTLARLQLATSVDPDVWGDAVSGAFDAGTRMLFQQTAAPTGWTKETGAAYEDAAFSCSIGAVATGGAVAFETAFASQAVAGTISDTVLTAAQLPAHRHFGFTANVAAVADFIDADTQVAKALTSGGSVANYTLTKDATEATVGRTSPVGSDAAHSHTLAGTAINLDVKFVDCIIATKN